MAAIARTKVSLRFFGDDLDPDELTALLGVQPTEARTKGQVRVSTTGREHVWKTGAWRLVAEERTPGDLEGQLRELFALTTKDLHVWRELTRRYKADVFCGLFMEESNEGVQFDPEILGALAERGLSIGLDIYDPSPD